MFIKDGIVYGEQKTSSMKIVNVKVLPDRIMLITFNTGETRLFDGTELKGPAYEPLKDIAVFEQPVLDHGILTWKKGEIDCSPEYIYDHSYEYSMVV